SQSLGLLCLLANSSVVRVQRLSRRFDLSQSFVLGSLLPPKQYLLRVPCLVVVHELRTRLAEPNAVADPSPLVWRHGRIVPWTSGRGGGDVRRHAHVQRLVVLGVWPAGSPPAHRIRAPVPDSLGERLRYCFWKLVSHSALTVYVRTYCNPS